MIQLRKIVNLALSRIGAINFSENPDTATSDVCVDTFRMMMDEFDIRFSNDKLYNITTSAKNILTLGTDASDPLNILYGDVSARPASITEVFYQQGSINFPINIHPYSDYNFIRVTNVAAIPTDVFVDYGFPYVTLNFYPQIGSAGFIKIIGKSYRTNEDIYLNDYVSVPREWNAAIVSNLALRLAPTFGIPVSPALTIQAASDLKHIKQLQIVEQMQTLRSDLTQQRRFNPIAGM